MTAPGPTLADLRGAIDRIDGELLARWPLRCRSRRRPARLEAAIRRDAGVPGLDRRTLGRLATALRALEAGRDQRHAGRRAVRAAGLRWLAASAKVATAEE